MLASALRTDPHCFRRLEPTDPTIVELRELVAAERGSCRECPVLRPGRSSHRTGGSAGVGSGYPNKASNTSVSRSAFSSPIHVCITSPSPSTRSSVGVPVAGITPESTNTTESGSMLSDVR